MKEETGMKQEKFPMGGVVAAVLVAGWLLYHFVSVYWGIMLPLVFLVVLLYCDLRDELRALRQQLPGGDQPDEERPAEPETK